MIERPRPDPMPEHPEQLRQFRSKLLSVLPRLALAAHASGQDPRSALVIPEWVADGASERLCFRVLPLAEGPGTAALQILEELAARPQQIAALVSSFREADGDTLLSITLATFGRQEILAERLTTSLLPIHTKGHGLIEVGAFAPLLDPIHEALDISLTV